MTNIISIPETPCYIIDERQLIDNLKVLRETADASGCKILLAQKAFSMFSLYPLIAEYLDGTAASGLFEARLGREHFKGEVHVFSAGYKPEELSELAVLCDHIVFNSFSQYEALRHIARKSTAKLGIRVNPQHSTQSHGIYDPCSDGSRLGVTEAEFREELLDGISGLHFHTLCEQNADALEETLAAFEKRFAKWLPQMEWVNFGGGHHITRPDYDRARLVRIIREFRKKYNVDVYLEPGEAIALKSGWLAATVLDIVHNDIDIAILDASSACHMPDVIEMPYTPPLFGSAESGVKPFSYRLAGASCLAGDVIGDYSFDQPLKIGDRLLFEDMAIYTMVKNNTFNGMPLPSIAIAHDAQNTEVIRRFGYEDFKRRLS